MNLSEKKRMVVVADLLTIARPLAEISNELAAISWDYEGCGMELTRFHLAAVLNRYLEGDLASGEIEMWANMIEGRDDIYSEVGYESLVDEIVYEIANPLLTQSLNPERARYLITLLS